jgi:ABC-type transport system involved in Fe-S cluster assembly fused permease/ATPase subunit
MPRGTVKLAARHSAVSLIAHRLSTVTSADQIVLLKHGQVCAVGRHEEMIESDQLYQELDAT